MIREIRYRLEYALVVAFLWPLSLMAPEQASWFSGWIARKVGPLLKGHKIALRNLKMAFPEKTEEEYKDTLARMWDNLGRMLAEYIDLEYFLPNIELVGVDHLKRALGSSGQAIIFSGHIGNWEIMAPALLSYGIPVDLIYRAPNNPWVDKLLTRYRSLNGKLKTMPKSRRGTRQLVEAVQNGRSVGILIDQKYNEGVEVPFLGHPAMTSAAFVQLSQKFNCPLIPFRVERIAATRFRLSFYPALRVRDENDENRPVEDVISEAHTLLESWITERPDQWLWPHRRWVASKRKK